MKSKDQQRLEEAYTSIFEKTANKILKESYGEDELTVEVLCQNLDEANPRDPVLCVAGGFHVGVTGASIKNGNFFLKTDASDEGEERAITVRRLKNMCNNPKVQKSMKVTFESEGMLVDATLADQMDNCFEIN